jgi:uncharacterized LabA/DUF88 family protein
MKKRTVILIDGQNLFYSLKSLGIYEKNIHWSKFFSDLISEEDELVRSYWFRPEKIHDSYLTRDNITTTIIKKHCGSYLDDFKRTKQIPSQHESTINEKIEEVERWINDQKRKFSQIAYNYDQISLNYGDIEIVKTGMVKIDPHKKMYLSEKGVDIALAVKMISLSVENKADKIILVSGDYDYSEAIKFVKNNMTKLHIVKFHKGYPPTNKNMSRDLSVLADKIIDIYQSDISAKYTV